MGFIPPAVPALGSEPVTAHRPVTVDDFAKHVAAVELLFNEIAPLYVTEDGTDAWIEAVLGILPQHWILAPVRAFVRRRLDRLLPQPGLGRAKLKVIGLMERRLHRPTTG